MRFKYRGRRVPPMNLPSEKDEFTSGYHHFLHLNRSITPLMPMGDEVVEQLRSKKFFYDPSVYKMRKKEMPDSRAYCLGFAAAEFLAARLDHIV